MIATLALFTVTFATLLEVHRQTGAAIKSADAATLAATTARDTLKTTVKSFQIEQRPYLVMEPPPQFLEPPTSTGNPIRVNIVFKDIGRTPAVKYHVYHDLLRFRPARIPPKDQGAIREKGTASLVAFLEKAYGHLRMQAEEERAGKYAGLARTDVAPNGSFFSTAQNNLPPPRKM